MSFRVAATEHGERAVGALLDLGHRILDVDLLEDRSEPEPRDLDGAFLGPPV